MKDELQAIVDGNPGTPLSDKIEDAVGKLSDVLGYLTQVPPDIQAAVGGIEGAVGELAAAVKDGLLPPAQGDQFMDQLAAITKHLSTNPQDQSLGQDEAYLDAVAGRIDLLLADSVAMDDGFLQTDQGMDFEFVGPNYSDPKYFGEGAGIAIRQKDTDLIDKFNAALKEILTNGTYKAINDKYFDFNVYGGPTS